MPFDERLAVRVRAALGARRGVTERRMFGGLAFLLDGRMFCGIIGDEIVARVGPDRYEACLSLPHARPMDFTGKPMKGYIYVAAAGVRTTRAVRTWVERGRAFVSSMTSKGGKISGRARAARPPTRGRTGLKRPIQPMGQAVRGALVREKLMAAYRLRPPYQRNDYLGWINRGALPATRARRLAQMIDELRRGDLYMGMNWNAGARGGPAR